MERRDIGATAVEMVRALEESLVRIDRVLRVAKAVGRVYLLYRQRDGSYEWRWRLGSRRSEHLGARLSTEALSRMRQGTRARALGLERLLDARRAGRTVLALLEAVLDEMATWQDRTVSLVWIGGNEEKITWMFILGAGRLRRGTWSTGSMPPATYLDTVKNVGIGLGQDALETPIADGARRLEEELEAVHRRLEGVAAALKQSFVRLCYDAKMDHWRIRTLSGRRWSRGTGSKVQDRWAGLQEDVRARCREAEEHLARRRRIKRGLSLVAVLAEAGQRWPGGVWHLRGEPPKVDRLSRKGGGAAWIWIASKGRLLKRVYHYMSTADVREDGRNGEVQSLS